MRTRIQKHLELRRNMDAFRKQSYPLLHLQMYVTNFICCLSLQLQLTGLILGNISRVKRQSSQNAQRSKQNTKKYFKKVFIKNIFVGLPMNETQADSHTSNKLNTDTLLRSGSEQPFDQA